MSEKKELTIARSPLLSTLSVLAVLFGGAAAGTAGMVPLGSGADDSAAQIQAAPQEAVPQEAVKLSAQAAFTSASPRVGDSLDYVLQVEWQEVQVPVVVLAPDSLDFAGFKILGQATVHKKTATGQDVRNHTEFIYRLRAQTQGSGRASSLKVRYLTGISHAEEALFVPAALIDILPAPVRLTDRLWFKLLGGLLLLGAAVGLAWASFRLTLRARKRKSAEPEKTDLRPELAELKLRLKSAGGSPDASKEILLAMEGLALRHLRQANLAAGNRSGVGTSAPAAPERFETVLETYLARNAGTDAQDWEKIRELARHARFAGGYKEPHELQDAFRILKRCLKITGEDEHE